MLPGLWPSQGLTHRLPKGVERLPGRHDPNIPDEEAGIGWEC